MNKPRKYTPPRKVDFRNDDACIEAAILGMMGCSTRLIMQRTGFTQCQTTYRLGKADIKRADYRNGESAQFKVVYNASHQQLMRATAKLMTRTAKD